MSEKLELNVKKFKYGKRLALFFKLILYDNLKLEINSSGLGNCFKHSCKLGKSQV